ncbi:Pycsar system effector family protein [Marinicella litoralis]|uniref:Pycsar effector protein domain-containing protein n=1 Tax=Marinicella litoralis TaxID=644220 RepID=A0A4R6XRQ5_9GAMM|nr:Pycsar system effector family protein [Marinicella litoralis]TDR20597.1 hypothetical protein C8D91_1571 [Marinicella litoralis]
MNNNESIVNKPKHDVIQTLRTAHQNQTQLNLMADQKANILIGTLVLMFTVVLTRLLQFMEGNQQLLLPLLVLVLMQLIPLVLTVLVLIPKNINGPKHQDISNIANPLFFGFFTRYSEQTYTTYLNSILQDDESARALLIKDIYQIGLILRRKYILLRMAYVSALLGVMVPLLIWLWMMINPGV